ncbi:hypothetical protein STAN_5197 [Streptomyces sp. CBMAI 2042]|nr:hypothetical protein STAN_5197 [Streptomyces sp. CBMAI 2042]
MPGSAGKSPGRHRESLPRVRSREIRRRVNYSVVTARSGTGQGPVAPGVRPTAYGRPKRPHRFRIPALRRHTAAFPVSGRSTRLRTGTKSAKPAGEGWGGREPLVRVVLLWGGARRSLPDSVSRPRAVVAGHGRPLPSRVTEGTHTVVRPLGCASPL